MDTAALRMMRGSIGSSFQSISRENFPAVRYAGSSTLAERGTRLSTRDRLFGPGFVTSGDAVTFATALTVAFASPTKYAPNACRVPSFGSGDGMLPMSDTLSDSSKRNRKLQIRLG